MLYYQCLSLGHISLIAPHQSLRITSLIEKIFLQNVPNISLINLQIDIYRTELLVSYSRSSNESYRILWDPYFSCVLHAFINLQFCPSLLAYLFKMCL